MVARTNGMKKGKATNLGTMCARKAYMRSFAVFIFPTKPTEFVKRHAMYEQIIWGDQPSVETTLRHAARRARARAHSLIGFVVTGYLTLRTALNCFLL